MTCDPRRNDEQDTYDATGRKPRRRIADLMIAATAIAEGLAIFTTNPGDYAGLDKLVRVVPVTRPALPHEQEP